MSNADDENAISSAGKGEPTEFEVVRWRPWPCKRCRRGTSPLGHIIRCYRTSAKSPRGSANEQVDARIALEAPWLREWARSCDHLRPVESFLPRLDSGSEHVVYLDLPRGDVIKLTRLGIYGDYYYLGEDGRINQCNCTPAEYLIRMRLVEKHFGFGPRPIGVTDSGQIVSRQQFVTGEPATQEEVDQFLFAAGMTAVKQRFWLWKSSQSLPNVEEWVGDARSDNFLRTAGGIVPIDLRMWQVFV